MRVALVVHLLSPGAAAARSGWDAPGGSVHHVVASWRDAPTTLSAADIVVAHGRRALAASHRLADFGPRLVYRPSHPIRLRIPARCRRLHPAWIAAPDTRTGRATAASLGVDPSRVIVVGDGDRAGWSVLVSWLLHHREPTSDQLVPLRPLRRPPSAVLSRALSPMALAARTAVTERVVRAHERRAASARNEAATVTAPGRPALQEPEPQQLVPVAPDAPRDTDSTTRGDATTRTAPRAKKPPRRLDAPIPSASRPSIIAGSRVATPRTLAAANVERTSPGHRWWMYRRPEGPPDASETAGPHAGQGPPPRGTGPRTPGGAGPPPGGTRPPTPEPEPRGRPQSDVEIVSTATRSNGVWFFVIGAAILATVAVCTQLGTIGEAPYMVPIGALFLALGAARRISRNHPDELWVGRWLVIGLIVKLLASYFRYFTLTVTYGGVGDASDYDTHGRQLASAWLSGGHAPVLEDLRKTNFIRWFTGVVYYVFGSNLLTGTFVFALLALVGSYFWYRATVDAVPIVNKRLYLGFVLLAPSIIFWPALVGKEALMQLALGTFALGISFLVRQRLLPGFAIAFAGGWLMWVVRPHLLALVAISAGAAYLAGRVRKDGGRGAGLLTRPLGIIIVAFLVAFTIGQGAQFLGLKDLSLNSVQDELDKTTLQTAQGGSEFNSGNNSLNPIYFPRNAVTVFLRPFPWELDGGLQILASLESAAIAVLVVRRFRSLRIAFSRSREMPFLMFAWVMTALYAMAFSSFANFGLLVRQRSLVLPALLLLFSIDPALEHRRREAEARSGST